MTSESRLPDSGSRMKAAIAWRFWFTRKRPSQIENDHGPEGGFEECPRSRPKDGDDAVPPILMGNTAPTFFLAKRGSIAFSKNDLNPVVVWESFASRLAVPCRSSF